jgi:hypothetical protein
MQHSPSLGLRPRYYADSIPYPLVHHGLAENGPVVAVVVVVVAVVVVAVVAVAVVVVAVLGVLVEAIVLSLDGLTYE